MDSDEIEKEVRWHGALPKQTRKAFTNSDGMSMEIKMLKQNRNQPYPRQRNVYRSIVAVLKKQIVH